MLRVGMTKGCLGLLWMLTLPVSVWAADEYANLTLNWKPPTQFSNGEKIASAARELKEYRVYYGNSRESVREHHFSVPAGSRSIKLSQLQADFVKATPVVYLAVSAVGKSGNESELSEIIFFLP